MPSKWVLLTILLLAFSLQGCETLYGAADGAKAGMKKDMENWKNKDTAIHRADGWMKEHMW